jgi:hypothetical protein
MKILSKRTGNRVPIVVIDKPLNDRMASTVRHNRARGKHAVDGMANLVFSMLEGGWTDAEVCNEIGLEAEEMVRLKYITGFAKLFQNVDYTKAWETARQIKLRMDYEKSHPGEPGAVKDSKSKLRMEHERSRIMKGTQWSQRQSQK